MAYGTYQTRNPKAVHNPLRSMPLFKPLSSVFGPSATDRMVGDLRNAYYALQGWQQSYTKACKALGQANKSAPQWRRANQRDAMRALNRVRTAMRANLRTIATLEADLLAMAVPSDRWAEAAACAARS